MKNILGVILGILVWASVTSSAGAAFLPGCGIVLNYDSAYSCEENKTYDARKKELAPYAQFFAQAGVNLTFKTSESQYKNWLAQLIAIRQKSANKSTTPTSPVVVDDKESLKKQLIQSLTEQLKSLQAQLAALKGAKVSTSTEPISVSLKSSSATFKKIHNEFGEDEEGEGNYSLQVLVTANKDDLYIPVSITTAKKSNGFIYQVEGTERATPTATVSCNGEDSVIVTAGSLSYCKVPAGKSVTFKVQVTVIGDLNEEYRVVVSRINYKLNTNDVRYKKFLTDIRTRLVRFH